MFSRKKTKKEPERKKIRTSTGDEKVTAKKPQEAVDASPDRSDQNITPKPAEDKNKGWVASQREAAAKPQESSLSQLWERAYGGCYYIGTQLLRDFLMVKRDLLHFWEKAQDSVPRALHRWQAKTGRRLTQFCEDLLFPYRIIAEETHILWNRLKAARRKVEGAPPSKTAFHEYFRATERPFNRIANFFAPIIGVAILAAVISYFNGMTFAVKVDYNGETLGYISSEKEFYEARNTMLDRLINEEYIPPEETIPTLSMAVVQQEDLLTRDELTNAIMEASGNELTGANGFYLEGQFLGAVEDGNEFLLYLDKILSNYRTGEEHEVVQFTKNITLEDGVYPISSIISLGTLQDYLRSDERLERTYSAKAGDTVATIAKRYSTTVDDLLRMNNELEEYLTDLRIQVLGYDPDATPEEEAAAVDEQWANDVASVQSIAPLSAKQEETLPADFPMEWLEDSKWGTKAAERAAEDTVSEPDPAATGEEETPLEPAIMALEDVPLQGGEEFLVAKINVSLGIQVTRRETYIGNVAYGTTYVEDSSLPNDYSATISAGIPGTEEILADITYVDGVETGETVISRTRLSDPINRKVKIGTLSVSEWLGATGSNFIWPVDGGYFNGSLGAYYGHTGMDIAGPYGTNIRASKSGTVTTAMSYGWNYGYGKTVVINHGNGVTTRYAHMSAVLVSNGQYVTQGTVIGRLGSTGNSSGNHCHFEIRINGVIMAPEKYIGYYCNRSY